MSLEIGPHPLKPGSLRTLIRQPDLQIHLSVEARERIQSCRDYLDNRLSGSKEAIYGINTGFGYLCDRRIEEKDLIQLQLNLIRSHACGMGSEVPPEIVKLMLVLKIRSLSFGHSGVQLSTVERLVDFFNLGILPVIYTQGSLGASGDLAPLAHFSLPLIGEGEVRVKGEKMQSAQMLQKTGLPPIELRSKEGLALMNGTQFMLAYGVHTVYGARDLYRAANLIAALSLDAFDCRTDAFHPALHRIRPFRGQNEVAAELLSWLEGSEIASKPKIQVQDPYSFRCTPQVHGASTDAIEYAASAFQTEVDSVSDNPNIFPEEDLILSGGNFHGQPLALPLDFLAIAVAELGSISERRVFHLLSGARSLPPFLTPDPGLHSGLMIPQYTAASIVSQNKQLCTPASVDTIPSSNGQEDHVSMGANSAVKGFQVLENARKVLGIELFAASQALSFREPLQTGSKLLPVLHAFREKVPLVKADRELYPDLLAATAFLQSLEI
jgi:histidine ammonia-lyase